MLIRSLLRFLLRGPGSLGSHVAKWAATLLAVGGAALMVWSAVIHLELWGDGYKDIATIGPLFLAQGVGLIVLALAVVAFRRLAVLAAGAVTMAATAVGLLLTVHIGLFGYKESLAVPYAMLSLYVEFFGAGVLAVGAGVLALAAPVRAASNPSRASARS
jgi:hypothetical protein